MSEYDELKRLAYDQWDGDWWPSAKGGYFDVRSGDAGQDNDDGRLFDYLAACKPSVIHGLIEEKNRYEAAFGDWIERTEWVQETQQAKELGMHRADVLRQRIDQLKAENEALRKDKDRLDALESSYWDVRHDSHPIADTGDSSSSIEIIGHWMDKPFERVIGEDYNENLRAAIDQAMKAAAYPPARPEYGFDEIPNFGGGSGNKARRRAESLGIDYDAAMSKES